MRKETHLPTILFLCLSASSLCFFPLSVKAQDRGGADPTTPSELTPGDPEIRKLLGLGDKSCKAPNGNAWNEKLQKALEMANSRGLVGDRALVEASLASAMIVQGKAEQAFLLYQKALQDSIESKRQILEGVRLTVEG